MRNQSSILPVSPLAVCYGAVGVLLVVYIGLIAVVMSSAVLTIEFSRSVRDNEAAISVLEARYLAFVASITNIDYVAEGYAAPATKQFVTQESVTVRR